MKVYISTDIEGTAGIVDWSQVLAGGDDYELGRRLLLDETNAAIDGAVAGGGTTILVNDSHSQMRNLPPGELHHGASYLSGRHKPLYMMEGLDGSFDAAMFVAYHGSVGAAGSVLGHTYNPAAIWEVTLNGRVAGESALNALVALHHRVPVVLISGDQVTVAEAEPFLPGVEGLVVKRSLTRTAAESLHPARACELIRAGAEAAVRRAASVPLPSIALPARLEVTFLIADMAEMATWVSGVEQVETRRVAISGERPLELFQRFVTVVALTRSIVETR